MFNDGFSIQDFETQEPIFSDSDIFYDDALENQSKKDDSSFNNQNLQENSNFLNQDDFSKDIPEKKIVKGKKNPFNKKKRSRNMIESEQTANTEEKKNSSTIFDESTNEAIKEIIDRFANTNFGKIMRRIENSDNIKIKLIRKFIPILTKQLNKNLNYFKLNPLKRLPENFVKTLIQKINQANKYNHLNEVNYFLKELYSTQFCELSKKLNIKYYSNNLKVIGNLENKKNIYINSSFYFENKKLSEILKEYVYSNQFAQIISTLKFRKKENEEFRKMYIERYIAVAIYLINLFANKK